MDEIRYEDIRELAKIASDNNVEITLTVNEEGLSVNIEKSRPMSITTTTTENEEEQLQENGDIPCNTCEYFHTAEEALPCCECMYSKVSKYRRAEQ